MKISILSDIHEGLNRKKTGVDLMDILTNWVLNYSPDVFIISGDMTAGPEKSLALLQRLQAECERTKFLFVHGNHDIYHEDSDWAYEKLLQFSGNLGNGPVELPDDWVVIGDGGWYDYSFGIQGFSKQAFHEGTFGDFTWPDKKFAHWQEEDALVSKRSIIKLEKWLNDYQRSKIILVTHMVPFAHFIQSKGDNSWDFFNAMMGSQQFGELALKYGVKKYIFGHIHTRYHEIYKGIEMICNPLGYYPTEWSCASADEEIRTTIKTIDI